jgi:ribonuclease P protein component
VAAEGFRPRDRLRRAADFRRVFRSGDRLGGERFLLVASANALGRSRLGLAVGRSVGSAVARNRAKRLLREAFRRSRAAAAPGFDLVLVAKNDIVGRSQHDVFAEWQARRARLERRGAAKSRREAAGRSG